MTSRKKDRNEQVSHKVIEKRRRDRINNCLAELTQTVPAAFAKQTSGKLEKAEILEMTVEYLRAINTLGQKFDNGEYTNTLISGELQRHFSAGYSECIHEVLRYITEVEGFQMTDMRCVRMMAYLQNKGTNLMDSLSLTKKSTGIYPLPISHSVSGSCELASDSRPNLSTVYAPQESPIVDNSQYFNYSPSGFPTCPSNNALNRCLGCSSLFKLAKSSSITDRVPFINKLVHDSAVTTSTYPTHKTNYMFTEMFPYNSVYSKHSLHLTSPMSSYGIPSLSKTTSLVSNSDSYNPKT